MAADSTVLMDQFKKLQPAEQMSLMFGTMLQKFGVVELGLEDLRQDNLAQKMRMEALEAENELLRKEIAQLKQLNYQAKPSTELKVCGIPSTCALGGSEITAGILKHLELESLVGDVLETRPLTIKSSNNGRNDSKTALIVTLKSAATRAHILKTKKKAGKLNFKNIFPGTVDSETEFEVYEMLPPLIYQLKLAAKKRAQELGYKFVWAMDGTVYVKKAADSDRIAIITEADLDKIT